MRRSHNNSRRTRVGCPLCEADRFDKRRIRHTNQDRDAPADEATTVFDDISSKLLDPGPALPRGPQEENPTRRRPQ